MADYFESSPEIERKIYRLYREFFDKAERRRRWSLERDIPWDQCNPTINPAVAAVVESFCAVELFLPDYTGKMLPKIRDKRGRAWFQANWGYEESKHSLALGDWLLKARQRTDEQMADLEENCFQHQWNLPMDSVRGMLCYSMTQELATWLHYRNLRLHIGATNDPALYTLLGFISTDERAHYDFFRRALVIHLEHDRAGTLDQLRRVLNGFGMPAVYMLTDGRKRVEEVKKLNIFDDQIFYTDVYLPILNDLGVDRQEMRRHTKREYVAGNGKA